MFFEAFDSSIPWASGDLQILPKQTMSIFVGFMIYS